MSGCCRRRRQFPATFPTGWPRVDLPAAPPPMPRTKLTTVRGQQHDLRGIDGHATHLSVVVLFSLVGLLVGLICIGCEPARQAQPAQRSTTTETTTTVEPNDDLDKTPDEGSPEGDMPGRTAGLHDHCLHSRDAGFCHRCSRGNGGQRQAAAKSKKSLLGVRRAVCRHSGQAASWNWPTSSIGSPIPRTTKCSISSLPLGLVGRPSQVEGVDENPLTRAKIELGRQLYFDPRLSADGTVSCATCHDPDEGFGRHTQFGVGIGGQIGRPQFAGQLQPHSQRHAVLGWPGRFAGRCRPSARSPIRSRWATPTRSAWRRSTRARSIRRNSRPSSAN